MKMRTLLTILSLALAATIIACNATTQQPPQTLEPIVIKEWTGVGDKTTEPFVIDSFAWAISWSFVPEPVVGIYANLLMVDVRKPNNSSYFNSVINIANIDEPISDHTYIYEKGTFYLDISSMSGKWSIRVIAFK